MEGIGSRPYGSTQMAELSHFKPPLHITLDCLASGRLACEMCSGIERLAEEDRHSLSSSSVLQKRLAPVLRESAIVLMAYSQLISDLINVVDARATMIMLNGLGNISAKYSRSFFDEIEPALRAASNGYSGILAQLPARPDIDVNRHTELAVIKAKDIKERELAREIESRAGRIRQEESRQPDSVDMRR